MARVETVDFGETRRVDVRVNLRRADVGVPQQFLNRPDVRSVGQHVRGKAMAQDMRGYPLGGDSDGNGALTDDLEDALAGERTPAPRQEDMRLAQVSL